MRNILFSCLLLLTACVSVPTVAPAPYIPQAEKTIDDFPPSPSLITYTRKPIIEKIDNDFKVSDEFVNNGVLLKKYNDRIDAWKKAHKIQ